MQNILVNQKICPLKENNTRCPLIVSALDDVSRRDLRTPKKVACNPLNRFLTVSDHVTI